MFDLGWSEMGVIAVVALIVLGPKELPNALRTVTQLMKNARKLANEFQSGVNEIVREADLEDARKLTQGMSKGSISKAIERAVDPAGEVKQAIAAAEVAAKEVPAREIPAKEVPTIADNPAPVLGALKPEPTAISSGNTDPAPAGEPAANVGRAN